MMLLQRQQLDASYLEPTALPSPSVWRVLTPLRELTDAALQSLPPVPEKECIPGILEGTDGRKVRFAETGPGGQDHELPYAMMEVAGLSVGDPALLLREFTGATIITRLQPGLLVEEQEQGADPGTGTVRDLTFHEALDGDVRAALFEKFRSE
ncbi:hypothetical protein [Streptomyces hydrogenans]|uniref:hypothetical protein n=1 Tax=Streptomyces hydrogenans TaxID=1873719 RepID=UPI0033DCD459